MARPYIIPSDELLKNPDLQEIFKLISTLKTPKECEIFFSDAFSDRELVALMKRWQAVKMIAQKIPYRQIAKDLGISTATVTRAAYSLYQERGGWQMLLRKVGLM